MERDGARAGLPPGRERVRGAAGAITSSQELDIFLLGACDSDSCLGATTFEFGVAVAPATYYLVVDGYRGAEGAYDLWIQAESNSLAPTVCESATVISVLNGVDTVVDDVCDRTNHLTLNSTAAPIRRPAAKPGTSWSWESIRK